MTHRSVSEDQVRQCAVSMLEMVVIKAPPCTKPVGRKERVVGTDTARMDQVRDLCQVWPQDLRFNPSRLVCIRSPLPSP